MSARLMLSACLACSLALLAEEGAVDRYGDPLPRGAVVRMGTTRLRHFDSPRGNVFSADGKLLASGGGDDFVRIWDPATGKEVASLPGSGRGTMDVVFSPDGTRLFTAGVDKRLRIWDVATWKDPRTIVPGMDSIQALSVSPDGSVVAAAMGLGAIRRWEVESGKELSELAIHSRFARSIAFHPDGGAFVSTGGDERVALHDFLAARVVWRSKGAGEQAVFSPDGAIVYCCGWGGPVYIVDAKTGKRDRTLRSPQHKVSSFAVSRDGKTLAISEYETGDIVLWDLDRKEEVRRFPAGPTQLPGRGLSPGMSFSPDGKLLSTGDMLGRLRIFDVAAGRDTLPQPGHAGAVTCLAFASDGLTLVTGGEDGTVRVWDAATGEELRSADGHEVGKLTVEREAPPKEGALKVFRGTEKWDSVPWRVSPDGASAISTWGGCQYHWTMTSPEEGHRFTWSHGGAFSPDGRTFALLGPGDRPGLYDATTGELLRKMDEGPSDSQPGFTALEFSPDGVTLAGLAFDAVHLWDASSGRLRQTLTALKGCSWDLALSHNGRLLAGRIERTLRLVEVATDRVVLAIDLGREAPLSIAFSPDDRFLALIELSGDCARLWEVPTGTEVCRLRGHRAEVECLAFAPRGLRLATGSADGTVLVWDVWRFLDGSTPETLDGLWERLALADGAAGWAASAAMTRRAEEAIPLLAKRLVPVSADPERVRALVAGLAAAEPEAREAARQELLRVRIDAAEVLRKELPHAAPEVAKAIREVLDTPFLSLPLPAGETLRTLRGIAVLEEVGSPASCEVLKSLAGGAPQAAETRAARAALARVEKRLR